ncbi:MAG: hypothetical protein RL375_4392 [Pseudomonadota bacterium]
MSISATSCHMYRALSVGGVPSNPTTASIFCWAKSTADASASRALFFADTADGASQSAFTLCTTGSDGIGLRIRSGGTEQINAADTDPGVYWWQAGQRNNWRAMAGWFDGAASAADAGAFWGTTAKTATKNLTGGGFSGLADDFYLLRAENWLWTSAADSSTANIRIAHVAVWFGYKLTSSDMTSLVAGTNPRDIGGGPTFYWPLATEAGDGLVDDIAGVTLTPLGGSATATWHDADNPTVSAPSSGGGSSIAAISSYYRMMRQA